MLGPSVTEDREFPLRDLRFTLPAMRYVALLRAVNVGKRRMKMEDLRTICENLGLRNVTTHIQSGNVIFDSRKGETALVAMLEEGLEDCFGFSVPAMVRSADEMQAAVTAWPFATPAPHESGFVGFLSADPQQHTVADLDGEATDELAVIGRHLYWLRHHRTTDFDNRRAERTLGVTSTLRNLNVARKLAELAATVP